MQRVLKNTGTGGRTPGEIQKKRLQLVLDLWNLDSFFAKKGTATQGSDAIGRFAGRALTMGIESDTGLHCKEFDSTC